MHSLVLLIPVLSLVWQCEELFEAFLKHGWLTWQQILDRVRSNQNEGELLLSFLHMFRFPCLLQPCLLNFNMSNRLKHSSIEDILLLVLV